ncbi:hypothetical protein Tco_0553340 [Tanacetum coccineum]
MGCLPRSALFLLTESQARLDPEFIGPWGSKWKIKSPSDFHSSGLDNIEFYEDFPPTVRYTGLKNINEMLGSKMVSSFSKVREDMEELRSNGLRGEMEERSIQYKRKEVH